MKYSPLAMKRRQILGDIYDRCNSIESIPVYLEEKSDEPLGTVDESMGEFADTFVFHLPEIICKKLSAGQFEYIFEFEYLKSPRVPKSKKRILLKSILLMPKVTEAAKKDSPATQLKQK